jgi:hypothetical protein
MNPKAIPEGNAAVQECISAIESKPASASDGGSSAERPPVGPVPQAKNLGGPSDQPGQVFRISRAGGPTGAAEAVGSEKVFGDLSLVRGLQKWQALSESAKEDVAQKVDANCPASSPATESQGIDDSQASIEEGAGKAAEAASALPSLSMDHNCIGKAIRRLQNANAGRMRSAYCIEQEVIALAKEFTIDRIGFLTLTFKDEITDEVEAQRRLRSLYSNHLRRMILRGIVVLERQHNGRIHYHAVVALPAEVDLQRDRFPWDEVKRKYYANVSPSLRAIWAELRSACDGCGFGRSELLPIRKCGTALGRYISKYLIKTLASECLGWKTKSRLVRFWGYRRKEKGLIKNHRKTSCTFAWNTESSRKFRIAAKRIGRIFGHWTMESFALACKDHFRCSWGWIMLHLVQGLETTEQISLPFQNKPDEDNALKNYHMR